MKIKKVNEKDEINLESTFYFLNDIKPFSKGDESPIEFIKSLNLSYDQYVRLAEIMEEYGNVRFEDGALPGWDDPSY